MTHDTGPAAGAVDTAASTALRSVGAVFDHVAHAVPSIRAVLPLYLDLLGGWLSGGGFNPWGGHVAVQIAYPGGGLIELLEPTQADSPSIGRFLERNPRGGLHHVTFKIKDLEAALGALRAAGFEPFGTMLDRPRWKETYLHPRQTGGVLIQLAQSAGRVASLDRPIDELLARAEEMRAGRA
jgi:methylmalonyl-CoA/ethylmalonyl-CoA epimerase